MAGETDGETLLFEFELPRAELEIIFAGGGEELGGAGCRMESQRDRNKFQRSVRGRATELVEFDQRVLHGERGGRGPALEDKFLGLDHALLKLRRETGGIAGEETSFNAA